MMFYFSGAGNSYAVAKQIAESIKDEQIIPLARFEDLKQCEKAERIGLVFSCYDGNAPDIVLDFKNKLFNLIDKKNIYVFAVITA
ncbi:MAG: hypothetical protein H7Y18_10030 [Clostridiaceae bacterium]|nr:hypothetical protein [Clostridiaceae bacterium]